MLPDSTIRKSRNRHGYAIVEFAAALVVIFPIVFLTVFTCYEMSLAFMIYNALNQSAHTAAMTLAKVYGSDPTVANNTSLQETYLQEIKYTNMVVSPNQFTVTFPANPQRSDWLDTDGNVPIVTVTCKYTSGQNGLQPFPYPDPLNIASKITLQATAVAFLE